MKKPSYEELEQRLRKLEAEIEGSGYIGKQLSDYQPTLRDQNIRLVKKSIELSDMKRALEDKNYELESTRADLRRENIDLVRKSIELSDVMRELEDRYYDLEQSQTELERALSALQESEKKYRTLVEESVQGIAVAYGLPVEFAFVNQAMADMIGYSVEELMSLPLHRIEGLIHEEDQEALYSHFWERAKGNPVPSRYEVRALRKDGSVCWLEILPTPITYQGKPALQAAFVDITERKQAEEALRLSEERFRELAELLPEIVLEIDDNGIITFLNRQAYKITGYTKDDFARGFHAENLLVEEDRPRARKNIQRVLRGERFEHHEYTAKRKSGTTFPVMVRSTLIMREGHTAGLRSIMIDLSERKHLEEQLTHTAKMEAIGQLAGGIAHDFNNLLIGILGYANLIRLKSDPGSFFNDAARTMESAAQRAVELTGQLLGFARRGKHQITDVDLHTVIDEVVALLSRTIDKSIRIQVEPGAVRAITLGDPGQLQQMLLNLSINARDAMPDGGSLTIRTAEAYLNEDFGKSRMGSTPGEYIAVQVVDTGCGIPPDVQDRIYEPFFTTKGEGKGTGMGLATAYGIIKNHDGEIEVSSTVGAGTTFTVYLPVGQAEKLETHKEDIEDFTVVGSGHILVVDDEEIVRMVVGDMLNELGYNSTILAGGKEAVEYYRTHAEEIDLVIVDLVMPDMGGRDCFRLMSEINPHLKAILSTGYGLDGKVQETLDEGILGFVKKPYRMNELGLKISQILGH